MNQKDIIINVLKAYAKSGYPEMTAREIFNDMEPQEQGAFHRGVDAVNQTLCKLRDAGIVENGISNIVNSRTILTWRLKHAQQLSQAMALDMDHRSEPAQQHQENSVETVDAEAYFDEVKIREHASNQAETQQNTTAMVDEAGSQPMETEAAFLADLERGMTLFIQAYKKCIEERDAALNQPKAPAIANKTEKLGLLNLLKSHYGYINSDFETVLTDIIADIEQIEQSEAA